MSSQYHVVLRVSSTRCGWVEEPLIAGALLGQEHKKGPSRGGRPWKLLSLRPESSGPWQCALSAMDWPKKGAKGGGIDSALRTVSLSAFTLEVLHLGEVGADRIGATKSNNQSSVGGNQPEQVKVAH